MRKFDTRSQPSIAAMFARSRKPAVAAQPAAVASGSSQQPAEADLQRSNAGAATSAAQQDLTQSAGAEAWEPQAVVVQSPDSILDAAASRMASGNSPAASGLNPAIRLAEQIEGGTLNPKEGGAAQLGHSPGQGAASGTLETLNPAETRPRKRRKEDATGSSGVPSPRKESSTAGGGVQGQAAALSSETSGQAMQEQRKSERQQIALEPGAAKRGTIKNRAAQPERGKGQSGIRSFFSPKKQ